MAATRLSSKGQFVIPIEIRKSLGLEQDDQLSVVETDGSIVLTPIRPADWKRLKGILKGASLTAELEAERRRERSANK